MPAGPARDAALDHLLAGQSNDCYWHGLFGGIYLPDLRVAALRRPDRGRGPGPRRAGRGRRVRARSSTSTSTAAAEVAARERRPDRRRSSPTRAAGSAAGTSGPARLAARGGHAAAAGGVSREAPRARRGRGGGGGPARRAGDAADADRSAGLDPRHRDDEAGRASATCLHYDADERRSGLVRVLAARRRRRRGGRRRIRDRATSSTRWTVPWELGRASARIASCCGLRRRPPLELRKTIRIGGGRVDPTLAVEVEVTNASASRVRGPARRSSASTMLLGGGDNPAALHEVGGRRIAHDDGARSPAALRCARPATTRSASRSRRRPTARSTSGSRRSRPSRTPRRASSSSTRAACVLLHRQVDARAGRVARRSASSSGRRSPPDRARRGVGPRVTRGRLAVHAHFYQPSRVDPWTGRVPEEPSAAPFHDWNARVDAECYRPNADARQPRPDLVGPRADARVVARRRRIRRRSPASSSGAAAATRSPSPSTTRSCRSRPPPTGGPRSRWGMRDFELRFGRRPAGLWLPETAVDLATLRDRRRGGRRVHDPRPVAGRRDGDRHPPALPRRARRRRRRSSSSFYDARAVGGGLVRAGGDVRRRPLRPRAGRPPRPRRRGPRPGCEPRRSP